jgi:hypothetical protein
MEGRIQTGLPPGKPSRHDEELKKTTCPWPVAIHVE